MLNTAFEILACFGAAMKSLIRQMRTFHLLWTDNAGPAGDSNPAIRDYRLKKVKED